MRKQKRVGSNTKTRNRNHGSKSIISKQSRKNNHQNDKGSLFKNIPEKNVRSKQWSWLERLLIIPVIVMIPVFLVAAIWG